MKTSTIAPSVLALTAVLRLSPSNGPRGLSHLDLHVYVRAEATALILGKKTHKLEALWGAGNA